MKVFDDLKIRSCPVCAESSENASLFLEERLDTARLDGFSFASRKAPEFMSYRLLRCAPCCTVYAAAAPSSARALILEAPHVFVEEQTISSIDKIRMVYRTTDLPQRLGRYHDNVDEMFWGWNDIWLNPEFRSWNIESCLESIRCPVLVIQGEDDEYGTPRQLAAIQTRIPATQIALFPQCRHAPHRDRPELTLRRMVAFLESLPAG